MLDARYEEYRRELDRAIGAYLDEYIADKEPGVSAMRGAVRDAMRYALEAGGKRIRGVLTLEFCRVYGGELAHAMPAAAAVELVHCFSLIHDDLPCMDDDDIRRGRPSCHKQFGEATALLAGDAMALLAPELIAREALKTGLPPERALRMIAQLCGHSGVRGMIGGQQLDLDFESENPGDAAVILEMYRMKTGALIASACAMGCIAAGADTAAVHNAIKYAESLGLAFQLVDDILDVTGSTTTLGKPAGSDHESGKATFISLYGFERTQSRARALTATALALLGDVPDSGFLVRLSEGLLYRIN